MPRHNRLIDLTDQPFGDLKVLYRADRMAGNGGAMWHCRCRCGREEDVSGYELRRGAVTQCSDCRRRARRNRTLAMAQRAGG
jgi:hypothetical protein